MKTKSTFFMHVNTKPVLIIIFLFVLSFSLQAQYCTATGSCYKHISRVQISNVDNTSFCTSYFDYTPNYTVNFEQGYAYQIAVTNPNHYSYDNDSCDVWIDWNKDSIFDNITEYYSLSNLVSPYTGIIKVTENAAVGYTRMRIRVRSGGIKNPCSDANSMYGYGEVEDYTVNIVASTPMILSGIYFNQMNGVTVPGNQNVKIGFVKVITDGGLNPLFLKNIDLNTLGSSPNISNAQLFYTNISPDFSMQSQFGLPINSPGSQLLFSDSISLLPDTNYFWLTYTVSGAATIGTHLKANLVSLNINDTVRFPTLIDTTGFVEIIAPLNGTYSVNNQGNGDYLSFSQAVSDLILRGVSGPVVFNVDSGTYNEQIVVPSIFGASATNTITFKSTTNDKSSVNLTYNSNNYNYNYTILLANASYIQFRDLTISSGYSSNYSRVIYITGSSNNITFIGNNITGTESYSGFNYEMSLLYATVSGSSNIALLNNTFINGSFGIVIENNSTDNLISGNNFVHQGGFGIYTNAQSNLKITNNNIYSDLVEASYFYGIYCNNGSGNGLISNNRIVVSNFNNIYGIYLEYYNDSINSTVVVNNFISLHAYSYSSGISLSNVSYVGIFYNSINIIGNNSNSDAFNIQNSSKLASKNNNISNAAFGNAISINNCNQCQSDYNNIYSNGTFARLNGNPISDLTSWTTAAQADSNSLSVIPQFLSDTNLHTINISLNGRAIPITGITTDIDAQTRNTSTPDIGADEFDPPAFDLQLVGFVDLPTGCGLTNDEKIKVIIKNSGSSNFVAGNASIKYSIDIPQQLVNETVNRNIASGDTIHFTFTTSAHLSVATFMVDTLFSIKSWVEYTNDLNHANDSTSATTLSKYLQAPPVVADTIIPYATNVNLNAQVLSDYIPLWYESISGINTIKVGNPLITPVLFAPDTFYVSSKKAGLNYVTLGTENNSSGYPFYTYYHDSKTQMLYTAAELHANGLQSGLISSIAFNIYSVATQPMNGFTIQMQNVSFSALIGFTTTGFATVYSGVYTVPGNGWRELVFQNPFYWDGMSNILVSICFDNTFYTSNSNVYSSLVPGKVWHRHMDGGTGCSLTGGSVQDYRPNIRFKGTVIGSGCESNRVPLHVGISNTPANDIGVTSILSPSTGFEILNSVEVGVVVRNYGYSTIDTIYISYQKDATSLPVTETILRTLASGDTLHYYFTQTIDISPLGIYNFKAYTHLLGDTIYINDTVYKTIENYTYCNAFTDYGCSYAAINDFVINTLANNNSGCNGETGSYIIYPENMFTTGLQKSISYPFSITQGINSNTSGYGIWIDLNHDGDFEDAGEFLYNTYTSSIQFSGNVNIPTTYNYTGKTRMRIRAVRYYNLYSYNSCTPFSEYGETEDYNITILPEPLQKDIQLVSIVKPDQFTYQLVPIEVIVKVKNIGLDTILQIPFSYIFNAQTPVTYTWNGALFPQQLIEVHLPQLTAITANNEIKVYAGLSGDMDLTNDTLVRSYVALPAPGLIHVNTDTVFGIIASCDSAATQTVPFTIYNLGYQPLNYAINQNTSTDDNFENGLNKWIANGSWGLINQGYNGGYGISESPSGSYGDGWDYYIQLKDSIYISNKDSCKIQYMLKYSMESCCDRLNTQISVNGGSWITLVSHGSNGTEAWNLKQIPFNSQVVNGDYIRFRFQFTSDGSVISDGVVIDDFSINGISNGNWATTDIKLDTIASGDSSLVNVTFKVGMLNAGIHSQILTISSNDPISPFTLLPLSFTIIGTPQIEVRDSVRIFPSIMAGVSAAETFKIYNTGCDSLIITAINNNDAAFTTVFPLFVMPRDSATITIQFYSLNQGLHIDTLTIFSNSELKHLYLSGTILPTPQLTLLPDSFLVNSSNCFDTISDNLQVKNTGNTTLIWNAYISKGAEKALAFNGSDAYVSFGNFGQLPSKGSVEFWMKANSNLGFKILYSSSGLNNNWKGVNVYQSDNNLYLLIGDDNGNYYNSFSITNNIDYGKWHHLAVTWDVTQNKVWTYFDGNVNNNGSYNPTWGTTISDVRLGIGYGSSYNYYFNGEMDELCMWSKNLTAAEINIHQNESYVIPSAELIGLWGFNETSGDTVYSFYNNKKGVLHNVTRVNSGAKINNPGIDVYPTNGVLADGDSSNVLVTFITSGLNSGSHYSGIRFTSNDPLHQLVIVPTHLVLSGSPQLHLLTTDLTMNSIMAGASFTDSMQFINTGCDTLKVTNITHSNSVFVLNQSSLNVLPRDTAKLKITFNPIIVGTYNDTLEFITNAGNQQLFVHAVALAAPVASVIPTVFSDTLTICNQSITKYFKIKNTGNEILSWNGFTGGVGMSDNFDNGINLINWSSISSGSAAASCGTALGNNALYFGGNGTRMAATKSLNTIGGGTIAFYLKISGSGGSPCEQADYGEDVVLEYSLNNGSNWNILQTFYTGYYNFFTAIQIPIPVNAQSFNTQFRWRQLSNSGSCCDHWSIDEVSINTLNINNIIPSSGTVAVGDSVTVQLTISGQGLINGNYISQVLINTNDPVHLQITIPVQLAVRANPLMTITSNPFIMDTVMIGAISSKMLYIKNTGCDSLNITNITHDLTAFTVNPLSLLILPRDSGAVNLTFSTLSIGNYTDTLRISSNAGNVNITVKAKTLGAPEIITLPDQITADFVCDSTKTTVLKIKNPGIVPLNWSAYVDNQEKGALQFNGINNYVNLGYWAPGTNWTVEAWVKPDVLSYGNKLIAGSAYGYAPWGISMVNSSFAAIYLSPQTGYSQALTADNVTLSPGNWYHVASTYNGSIIRLYINGQLVKSAIVNYNYSPYGNPMIGGSPSYGNYFSGSIDEVRIWNNARPQNQISYAMNHILMGNESGLMGYWSLNKVNGITVADLSSYHNNGTVNGASFSTNASPALGWVNLSNNSGIISVGDSTNINLSLNRHLLSQGLHPFNIIIQSDDPVKPFDTTLVMLNVQHNLIPVDIGSDTNLCTGNSLIVSAGSYASYVWSNNTSNSSINITNSGTYHVSVIDGNGCEFKDTIQVGLTQSPVANAGLDKSVCQSNSVSLNGSASGGNPPYQYFWKNEFLNLVSTAPNYYFTPSASVLHFLSVIDNSGCASAFADTVIITVNSKPVVNAGNDTVVDLGTSVTLNGSISGGTYPYAIQWYPANQMSANNILNPVLTPTYSTSYSLSVTDANNCIANDYVSVTLKYTISGKVVYNNSSQTPMPAVKVYLETSSNVIKDSVLTDALGNFDFSKVDASTVFVYAKPTTIFGGVNSTDALGIRRHIVNFAPLSGVNLNAADVNKSSTVSSADALLVLRRTIGLISSFTSGDWTSEKLQLYVSSNLQNRIVKVLCMGDVNGSYNIFSKKSTEGEPELKCIPTTTTLIAGETFNLPVIVRQSILPGAVTLYFQYPDDVIEINAVSINGIDIEFNIHQGVLSVGAYNEEGIRLNNNILLSINCRVKQNAPNKTIGISLLNQSEIADLEGKVITGLQLEAACMNIVDKYDEFKMEDNFPNPFSSKTTVRIYIPEKATIRMSIINTIGIELKSVVTENLSMGWHDLQIDAGDLSQGSYMYRLQAVGLKQTFDQTRRMMIIR